MFVVEPGEDVLLCALGVDLQEVNAAHSVVADPVRQADHRNLELLPLGRTCAGCRRESIGGGRSQLGGESGKCVGLVARVLPHNVLVALGVGVEAGLQRRLRVEGERADACARSGGSAAHRAADPVQAHVRLQGAGHDGDRLESVDRDLARLRGGEQCEHPDVGPNIDDGVAVAELYAVS